MGQTNSKVRNEKNQSVGIIGAGPAGLAAGRTITKTRLSNYYI